MLGALLLPAPASADDAANVAAKFDAEVAPLLARRCLECHAGSEPKGGLDLSRRATALAGGESGKALVPGKPEASLAWQRVSAGEMPPEHPLSAAERGVLKDWIARGAAWGSDPIDPFRVTTDRRAGYDWWSLQPVKRPELPPVRDADWPAGPLDYFVLARLEAEGLAPSPPADRRALIRRLSFDLLGLPPNPEDVEAFVRDGDPRAYEALVDRLLASPHYGERWARHWLDVVHFGESQGFERDKLRTNSWRYRDWVVDALNRDLPYDEFARLQLAGDVLRPGDAEAVIATGFLVTGPYDEVGQQQQSAAMKAVVRQDEMEDLVSLVGQTFLGLTVNCARCHDHKFDPIRQEEYYRLTAALSGVRHGERELPGAAIKDAAAGQAQRIAAQLEAVERQIAELDAPMAAALRAKREQSEPTAVPEPIARWEFDGDLRDALGALHGTAHGGARVEDGRLVCDGKAAYVATAPLQHDLREKTLEAWVRLEDLSQRGGGVIGVQTLDGNTFDAIVFGEREPGRWMAGSDFFRRSQSFDGPAETDVAAKTVHVAVVYAADGTITGYRNGRRYGKAYKSSGPVAFKAGAAQVLFGLRHGTPGGNRLLAGAIERPQLYDRALTPEEVAASAGVAYGDVTEEEILAAMTEEQRGRRAALRLEIEHLRRQHGQAASTRVYAVAPRKPERVHLLLRGNPAAKGKELTAGGVRAVAGVDAEFGLKAEASDAERRKKLAAWVTDANNPLFARVIANRLWHYHFGTGIVNTPSDLGFNGGRPSHPKLLDWLAAELAAGDWSLKHLHRTILLSAAYRQASRFNPAAAKIDAGNRLLWRKSPLRLEAEAVRDAILSVSGELNPAAGGPGYQDFSTYVHNTQFYKMLDPAGRSFRRRSLYRTWVRSGRNRFLDVFDCPDPSTKSPNRAVTTTPLQALALLNNSFVLRMADRFAARVRREAGEQPESQAALACRLAYGRAADADEVELYSQFVRQHGLPAFCRVVFNSNEFLYVD